MDQAVYDFLCNRIEDIAQGLKRTNGEYALALERRKELYKSFDHIVSSKASISISGGDCLNLQDYFEQDLIATAIMQQTLYRQGYLDCVKLLSLLGALS